MKYVLAAVLAIILLLPITVQAGNKKKGDVRFTAGTAGGSVVIAATYSYTIINDGTNTFFWNCVGATPGIAATNAGLRSGESIEMPIPCHTMTYDTTTGNADIRIIYIK